MFSSFRTNYEEKGYLNSKKKAIPTPKKWPQIKAVKNRKKETQQCVDIRIKLNYRE